MDLGTMTNDELADQLAEMYPGEVPDNDQILDWVTRLEEKARKYDGIVELEQEAHDRHHYRQRGR
jgi:hypothetical protein